MTRPDPVEWSEGALTRAAHRPECPVERARAAGDRHDLGTIDALLGPNGEDPKCSCPPATATARSLADYATHLHECGLTIWRDMVNRADFDGPLGVPPPCSCGLAQALAAAKEPTVAAVAAPKSPLAAPDWHELDDDERLPVYENLRERAATARWSADLFAKTAQEQAADRAAKRPDDKRIIIAAAFDAALAVLEALAK